MNNTDPLQNLRDIHLPAPISWWPLAPGWYVLITLLLLLLTFLIYRLYKKIRRESHRKIALKSLQRLHTQFLHQPETTMRELSMLLKRSALTAYSRDDVAHLNGLAWLEFLDKTGRTNEFTQGVGSLLIKAPYQSHLKENTPIDKLIKLIENWIKKNV